MNMSPVMTSHYADSLTPKGLLGSQRGVIVSSRSQLGLPGMLEAERSFRRVRGHKDMVKLVDALRREVTPAVVRPEEYDQAAA